MKNPHYSKRGTRYSLQRYERNGSSSWILVSLITCSRFVFMPSDLIETFLIDVLLSWPNIQCRLKPYTLAYYTFQCIQNNTYSCMRSNKIHNSGLHTLYYHKMPLNLEPSNSLNTNWSDRQNTVHSDTYFLGGTKVAECSVCN